GTRRKNRSPRGRDAKKRARGRERESARAADPSCRGQFCNRAALRQFHGELVSLLVFTLGTCTYLFPTPFWWSSSSPSNEGLCPARRAFPAAVRLSAKQEGRTCEYNGRIYQNGENFQPSCKHQCTCIDGAVGCQPLCPLELPLASLGCPSPRLLKVPGQCCKKFVCSKGPKKYGGVTFEYNTKGEVNGNELIYVGKGGHWKNLPAWGPLIKGQVTKQLHKCLAQTSSWSPCSKTCGFGISVRVTSDNPQCKLVKETRLCQIRPCGQPDFTKLKKGKKCLRTHKVREPVRFTYAGCKSPRRYQPSFCGTCLDGRCCVPLRTRTLSVPFHCPDGSSFAKNIMMIHSCQCGPAHCPLLNEAVMGPQYQLNGDIHKFLE
uniref:CCN family member 1 n=1 Tax=Anolis carolinensis TaxID=28377 RepID=A0A803SYT8_ANOCA